MSYRSNPYRKDNPRWATSNAAETPQVPATADFWQFPSAGVADRVRAACGLGVAWCFGLPRRAGARLHAMNDAEARWQHWQVTEGCGGLVHRYRDERFSSPREELQVSLSPPAGDR